MREVRRYGPLVLLGGLLSCGSEKTLFDLTDREGREVGFLLTVSREGRPRRTFGPVGLDDGRLVSGEPLDFVLRADEESAAMILWNIDRLSEVETGLITERLDEIRLVAEAPPDPPELEFVAVPNASILSRAIPEDTTILAEPASVETRVRALLDGMTLRLPVDPEDCGGDAVEAFVPFAEQSELPFANPPDLDDIAMVTESLVVAMAAGRLFVLRRGVRFDEAGDAARILRADEVRPGAIFRSVASLGPPDKMGRFTIAAVLQGTDERAVALIDATSDGFQEVRTATVVRDLSLTHLAGRPDGRYFVTSSDGAGVFGSVDGPIVRTRWSTGGENAENERATAIDDPRLSWLVDTRLAAYVYDEELATWLAAPYPAGELFPRIGGHAGFRTPDGDLQLAVGSRRGMVFGGPLANLTSVTLKMPPRFAPCTPTVDSPSAPLVLDNRDVAYTAGSLFFTYGGCNAIFQIRPASYCVSLVLPEGEGFREFFRIERLVARDGIVIASGERGRVLIARVPE